MVVAAVAPPVCPRDRRPQRSRLLLLLVVATAALSGCYQARQPPQIDEPIRVTVVSDRSRLVQAQAELQRALADSLQQRLGWEVSPVGSARLEVAIQREEIGVSVRDAYGLPVTWSIRLQGIALLTCQKATLAERFTGVAYATSLADEDAALARAAANAAFTLTSWLETEIRHLR